MITCRRSAARLFPKRKTVHTVLATSHLHELGSAVLTLAAIWLHCCQGGKSECWPSIARLAYVAGIPEHKVKRDLAKLERLNYINRRQRAGGRKSTTFRLLRRTREAYQCTKVSAKFLTISRSAVKHLERKGLSYSARLVYALLEWRRRGIESGMIDQGTDTDDDIDAEVEITGAFTRNRIGKLLGLSRLTVKNAVSKLVWHGLISVHGEGLYPEYSLRAVNLLAIPSLDNQESEPSLNPDPIPDSDHIPNKGPSPNMGTVPDSGYDVPQPQHQHCATGGYNSSRPRGEHFAPEKGLLNKTLLKRSPKERPSLGLWRGGNVLSSEKKAGKMKPCPGDA